MTYRAVLGYDRTFSMGTDFSVWVAEPSLALRWTLSDQLTLSPPACSAATTTSTRARASVADTNPLSMITASLDKFYGGSAYARGAVAPDAALADPPGRARRRQRRRHDDARRQSIRGSPSATSCATATCRSSKPGSDDSAIWLKGSAGIYHQPPRFVLPLPGLDMMPLKYGLLRSYQTSLGAEVPFPHRFQLSVEGFFNYMDPTIFDLSVNATTVVNRRQQHAAADVDRDAAQWTGRSSSIA